MTRAGLLLYLLMLGGCASAPRVETQTVKVPVPVECREPTPDRPSMPTEALTEDADPFDLLRASLAEIDRREGYEVKLVAAMENCKRPLNTPTPPESQGLDVREIGYVLHSVARVRSATTPRSQP